MLPGFKYGTYNDVEAVNDLVTDKTCGVIVEPIQGEGGVNVATEDFLSALAARCREVGAVLIYDEIQCGLSRTGTFWAHSMLPREAHPDIITTAKALGNGDQVVPVHLKIDTGMGRFGCRPDEAAAIAKFIDNAPSLRLAGTWATLVREGRSCLSPGAPPLPGR